MHDSYQNENLTKMLGLIIYEKGAVTIVYKHILFAVCQLIIASGQKTWAIKFLIN